MRHRHRVPTTRTATADAHRGSHVTKRGIRSQASKQEKTKVEEPCKSETQVAQEVGDRGVDDDIVLDGRLIFVLLG